MTQPLPNSRSLGKRLAMIIDDIYVLTDSDRRSLTPAEVKGYVEKIRELSKEATHLQLIALQGVLLAQARDQCVVRHNSAALIVLNAACCLGLDLWQDQGDNDMLEVINGFNMIVTRKSPEITKDEVIIGNYGRTKPNETDFVPNPDVLKPSPRRT